MSEEQVQEQHGAPSQRVTNADGSTNWTVLFEDPEQGILAAVRAAKSITQLRSIMASVAKLLFKRKRDAEPRADFLAHMGRIMDGAEIDGYQAVQARIVAILDAEKTMRIEKAALHAKNKLTQSIERRRESTDEGLLGTIIGNPFFLAGAVAGVLSIIALALVAMILPSGGPAGKEPTHAADSHQTPKSPESVSPQPRTRPAPLPPPNEVVALKPILGDVLVDGKRRRLTLVPLIEIKKGEKISPFCGLSPWIIEGVLIHVGAVTEAGRNMDDNLIRDIAAKVTSGINARSGGTKVQQLILYDIRNLSRDVVLASNRGCERVRIDLQQ